MRLDSPREERQELMARCGFQMPRKPVVMLMKEFEDEFLRVSIRAPRCDHPLQKIVLLVFSASPEKLINRQSYRNRLIQHS